MWVEAARGEGPRVGARRRSPWEGGGRARGTARPAASRAPRPRGLPEEALEGRSTTGRRTAQPRKGGAGKGACRDAGRPRYGLRVAQGRPWPSRAARLGAEGAPRVTAVAPALQRGATTTGARREEAVGLRIEGPSEGDGASGRTRDEAPILPCAAQRRRGEAGFTPVRGVVVPHRIPGRARRLLLPAVAPLDPEPRSHPRPVAACAARPGARAACEPTALSGSRAIPATPRGPVSP